MYADRWSLHRAWSQPLYTRRPGLRGPDTKGQVFTDPWKLYVELSRPEYADLTGGNADDAARIFISEAVDILGSGSRDGAETIAVLLDPSETWFWQQSCLIQCNSHLQARSVSIRKQERAEKQF